MTLVTERFESDRPMVRFAISDTGIGMTEEQLGRLFDLLEGPKGLALADFLLENFTAPAQVSFIFRRRTS